MESVISKMNGVVGKGFNITTQTAPPLSQSFINWLY